MTCDQLKDALASDCSTITVGCTTLGPDCYGMVIRRSVSIRGSSCSSGSRIVGSGTVVVDTPIFTIDSAEANVTFSALTLTQHSGGSNLPAAIDAKMRNSQLTLTGVNIREISSERSAVSVQGSGPVVVSMVNCVMERCTTELGTVYMAAGLTGNVLNVTRSTFQDNVGGSTGLGSAFGGFLSSGDVYIYKTVFRRNSPKEFVDADDNKVAVITADGTYMSDVLFKDNKGTPLRVETCRGCLKRELLMDRVRFVGNQGEKCQKPRLHCTIFISIIFVCYHHFS